MASASTAPTRSIWIISPICDLAFIILAPLAILPATWLLTQTVWTPETLFLVAFCFASLGHHLPGFLRAYGDREVFARHPWRLMLAPPACLAVAWFCIVWQPLRSFELLLMAWSTWHILMQTYGFLRIYDIKAGRDDRLTARLDWILCLLVFAAGFVFSNSRMFGLAEATWQAGLPTPSPLGLATVRWIVGAMLVSALVAAGANAARQRLNWSAYLGPKTLLLASTGIFYWLIGGSTVSMLLAVAMFDVFHAVQYFAIVWAFNVRLGQNDKRARPWLAWLFRQQWHYLAAYLAAIAAFGSLGLWLHDADGQFAQRWGLALFSASAMLHFYTDGFIWRVSQPATRAPLAEGAATTLPTTAAWDWQLIASWAVTISLLLGLGWWEVRRAPFIADGQTLLVRLTSLTPDVPELQIRSSQAALLAGDKSAALALARSAAERRPRSFAARLQYGAVLAANEQWDAAAAELTAAEQLRPGNAMVADAWGEYAMRRGLPHEAATHYRLALARFGEQPAGATTRSALVRALIASGEPGEAVVVAEAGLTRRPQSPLAAFDLALALAAAGRHELAVQAFEQALAGRPDWAEAQYRLGMEHAQTGHGEQAREALRESLRLDENQAQVHFQLGNLQYQAQEFAAAAASFRRCNELAPRFVEAYCNLGAVLSEQDLKADARTAYLTALRIDPNHAAAHYNLGLLYLEEGRPAVAREHITRAARLGQSPSEDVAKALGL